MMRSFESAEEAINLLKSGLANHAAKADAMLFLKGKGMRSAKIASISGLSDHHVRHYIRIACKLDPACKAMLDKGVLTFSMARAIASLPAQQQESAARNAIGKGVSVNRLRARLGGKEHHQLDEKTRRHFERLAMMMSEQTGLPISIHVENNNRHAGTVSIKYCDLQDFDVICDRLGIDGREF